MARADALRRSARLARRPLSLHAVDVLEIDVSVPERFPTCQPPPGMSVRVFERLDDSALSDALPPDRLRLLEERAARGDVYLVAFVESRTAGWVTVARSSHRDPWSGLRVRLAPDEIYVYDLWIHPRYRRSGIALHLSRATLRYAADDPALSWLLCWADEDNVASQRLMRDVLGLSPLQKVRYARIADRVGARVPFSDTPRYGPFSRRGRHRNARS